MHLQQRLVSTLLVTTMMLGISPLPFVATPAEASETVHHIVLSSSQSSDGTWSHSATVDEDTVAEYDYTWNVDPSESHDDVKNMPAVYYTGTAPSEDDAVYIAHDISYFPELDTASFVKQQYDGEEEWCYYYTADDYTDYVFATLPVSGDSVPTEMMHSADEAYNNAVLHITEAGTYDITGNWHGQIWVDLGEDAASNPNAKVKLILNGVDVTCDVAAAVVFANVYECDTDWEDSDQASAEVDTTEAGALVEVADGTENNFTGTNIYRLLKTTFKKDDATPHSGAAQKKYLKIDGAFYSYMSMNIDGQDDGSGVLNINATFEGLDSELHLTQNGATVNIQSGNDGINTSEDDVSVFTINDGTLNIEAGLDNEGDGIDSNGYAVFNGGTVLTSANPRSDSGIDSASGTLINGGTVFATGSGMDQISDQSTQTTMNLQFAQSLASDKALLITDDNDKVLFAYDGDQNALASETRNARSAIISSAAFNQGSTTHVYLADSISGEATNGLYDASTVTLPEDAVQQGYSGTTSGGPGGGGEMGTPPELSVDGVTINDDGSLTITESGAANLLAALQKRDPDTTVTTADILACTTMNDLMSLFGGGRPEDGGTPPQGGPQDGTTPPEPPSGENPPERPEGGMTPPDGEQGNATAPTDVDFELTALVNNFAGVATASTDTDSDDSTAFTDVSSDAYYYDAVQWAVENNITHGTTATTFSPDQTCTRAQLVAFLWNAAGSPSTDDVTLPFNDVANDAWYADAVKWGYSEGLISGTSADTFAPNQTVTRAEAMVFLHRQAGTPDVDTNLLFDDIADSDWYAEAIKWGTTEGVTHGTSSTTFSPKLACTRAQIVTFLHNAMAA